MSTPWKLSCLWCDFYCLVFPRGMRGQDMGSGVEAAETMKDHIEEYHDKTWREYLKMSK